MKIVITWCVLSFKNNANTSQFNKLYLNKGDLNFTDITEKAGLNSEEEWKTGVNMVDINGDGFIDIYQTRLGGYKNISGKNQLFINNGDLTFTERAEEYGLDLSELGAISYPDFTESKK